MGASAQVVQMLARARVMRVASVASRRHFAAAGSGDAIKDLFASEFAALGKRLEAAREVEKEVPAEVFKAMEEEVAAAKQRTGLNGLGQVELSKKLKIGNL